MGLGKAIHKIFSGTEDDEKASETRPHRNELTSRVRSQSTGRWWRNKTSSRERLPISAPYGQFQTLSQGVADFDSRINEALLSHLLIWYIYYDVVQVAGKGSKWFKDLAWESMVGWIGLGLEFGRSNHLTSWGLHYACGQLHIDTGEVATRLIRLSDSKSMLKSELVSTASYEAKVKKLDSDLQLVKSLQPIPHSRFEVWEREIISCINEYQEVVFLPVTNVGHFGLPPAEGAEIVRRNAIRDRLKKVESTQREAPPEGMYIQAHDLVNGNHVAFLEGQPASSSAVISPSENGRRGCPQPCRDRTSYDHTRRKSAPNLFDDTEMEWLQRKIKEMDEKIGNMQRLHRNDSLAPAVRQCPAALCQNLDHSNYEQSCSNSTMQSTPCDQPGARNLIRSTNLRSSLIQHTSQEIAEASTNVTVQTNIGNETSSRATYSGRSSRPRREGSPSHLPRDGHLDSSERPTSQPMVHDRDIHRPSRNYRLGALDPELASVSSSLWQSSQNQNPFVTGAQTDQRPRGESDRDQYQFPGHLSRDTNDSYSPRNSLLTKDSFVTNPHPDYKAWEVDRTYSFNKIGGEESRPRTCFELAAHSVQSERDFRDNAPAGQLDTGQGFDGHGNPKLGLIHNTALDMASRSTSNVALRGDQDTSYDSLHHTMHRLLSIRSGHTVYVTPPTSPVPSLRPQRLPGAWPIGSEAGPSRLSPTASTNAMKPSRNRYDPARSPSLAAFSDVTDPGEVTNAIRYRTRRLLESATLLDLSSSARQSFERYDVDEDENEDEGLK